MEREITGLCATTIRMLAIDGIQKANSGHPGMPMGTADMAMVLWDNFLRFNPKDPRWLNRDRFVLSAGHGSMLLYSVLHLFGYEVTLEDLKSFRQWESRTPGHPERGCLPGVESTAGPLGQGVGMSAGMALAALSMAARFNSEKYPLFDHKVYSIAGDGDLMEGVASEAASLAGHLKLHNLICLYDSNRITIEGSTELAFTEDVGKRFESYGWKVKSIDGHDFQEIFDALAWAQGDRTAPKLIIAHTHIAKGSPHKQDTAESHGSPLGKDEVKATKENLKWPLEPDFHVPEEVKAHCAARVQALRSDYDKWQNMFTQWKSEFPDKADELARCLEKKVPDTLEEMLVKGAAEKDEATRVSSGAALQILGREIPALMGGCADLEPSIKCHIKSSSSVKPGEFAGRNIHFGIREHGMGAIVNGMALYGGLIPYGGTFLVFSDYMKPAIRLSALMEAQAVYIFTHDSIFLGEDGPTHQPIEHLGGLRIIPNLKVIRPADALETSMAWLYAVKRHHGPTALILSRQNVPQLTRPEGFTPSLIHRGGYTVKDSDKSTPDFIILASGSEVHLACRASSLLKEAGLDGRVVSMPSIEIFLEQDASYRKSVIPEGYQSIVAIESSCCRDWDRFLGMNGLLIGLTTFGHSAPAKVIAEKYGLNAEGVKDKIQAWHRTL